MPETKHAFYEVQVIKHENVLEPKRQEYLKGGEVGDGFGWVDSPNEEWSTRKLEVFSAMIEELDVDAVVAAVFPGAGGSLDGPGIAEEIKKLLERGEARA
jgi:hypothetical protein